MTLKEFGRQGLRSGFGSQPLSTKSSNPSFGFGSSVRESSLKQYISGDHAKVMPGNNSQGPIYKTTSAMGPQAESRYQSSGLYSFGTAPRLPKPGKKQVPGPGAYKAVRGYGDQPLSTKTTAARMAFGTATRDAAIKVYQEDADKAYYGLGSPGPCAYNPSSGAYTSPV
ncbi:unnamed protein product [Pedinophyceae sp. YPF-701]|nr:unnamed protein product [Pedinophyceae sp. YPF-701]